MATDLRKLIKDAGFNQASLARKYGYSPQHFNMLLGDKRRTLPENIKKEIRQMCLSILQPA